LAIYTNGESKIPDIACMVRSQGVRCAHLINAGSPDSQSCYQNASKWIAQKEVSFK
jgi:hypothetical protein